ncbi:molybdopterin-dependent oxidoreductase [Alicyclobacillus curvatus]|nr:molybdopterin-dependent oxidoreductase [Alicyclobacillus curvatus]
MTTVFGNGADTASYDDFENTDCIIAWGSNAQEAHPVIWNHMRRGVKNGAKLVVIDPRKLPMAKSATYHLAVKSATDIALANAMANVIIREQLYNLEFVQRVTVWFDEYRQQVDKYSPEYAEEITGIPAQTIREVARLYATSARAIIAWTLGVTEHHNGADNVHAIINLALLTGHVGRPGCGLMPLRGQNNVQGGADMGALPNKLPGFFDVTDELAREMFEQAWNCIIPPKNGLHLAGMFDAAHMGLMRSVYIIGENPAQSDANSTAVVDALTNLDFLVVQDLFLTKTAALADVVLPAAGWAEVEGTFTNSERGVQRVRQLVHPPGEARSDIVILQELANRLGENWHYNGAGDVWDELRRLSPSHFGMSYERLDEELELQWPCPSLDAPPARHLHTRLHEREFGAPAPFVSVEFEPPIEPVDEDYPLVLITGRRLAFYNTGVMTSDYGDKVKGQEEVLEISFEDAERLGISDGHLVVVSSRRGSVRAPVKVTDKMQAGNVWLDFHFPNQVNTNVLTNDRYDKKSGVAPYKYTAVRVEKL